MCSASWGGPTGLELGKGNLANTLAHVMKTDLGPLFAHNVHFRPSFEQVGRRLNRISINPSGVVRDEPGELVGIFRRDPACRPESRLMQSGPHPVFVLQPLQRNIELQFAESAKQHRGAGWVPKYLNRALLSELKQSGLQLLHLHWIVDVDALEYLGSKERQPKKMQ